MSQSSEVDQKAVKISKPKFILDTDMGWDDVLSILVLLKQNESIDLIGVTITGLGEAHLDCGKVIALSLLELGNSSAVVSVGSNFPVGNNFGHAFPDVFREQMDGVLTLRSKLPKPTRDRLHKKPAHEFIHDTLEAAKEKITIISIGGLTNIAFMLQDPRYKNQDYLKNLDRIVIMGGAVNVLGNISLLESVPEFDNHDPAYTSNTSAEWNIFIDPLSAKIVFDSNIALTVVPLDACNPVLLDPEFPSTVTAQDGPAVFAHELLVIKATGPGKEGDIDVPIFDPLATLIAIGAVKALKVTDMFLDVNLIETTTDNKCGKTSQITTPAKGVERKQPIQVSLDGSKKDFTTAYGAIMNAKFIRGGLLQAAGGVFTPCPEVERVYQDFLKYKKNVQLKAKSKLATTTKVVVPPKKATVVTPPAVTRVNYAFYAVLIATAYSFATSVYAR